MMLGDHAQLEPHDRPVDGANPRLQWRQRQIFWVVVAGLAALVAFPWYAPLLIS
jgi:hypothetical protein